MSFYDLNKMIDEPVNQSYRGKAVYGDALTVGFVEARQGEITQSHSHDTEEVILVLKGCWLFHLPDGDICLRDNQMIHIPAGVEHSAEVLEDTTAIDICSNLRADWRAGRDRGLHVNPEQSLWAV